MDLTNVAFDSTTALAVATLVLVGYGAIWGAKRALGFSRS